MNSHRPALVLPTQLSISNIQSNHTIGLSSVTKNPDQHHQGNHTVIELSDLGSENRTTLTFLLNNTTLQNSSLKLTILHILEHQIKEISDEDIKLLYDQGLLGEFNGHMCNICLRKVLKENIIGHYDDMLINASMIPEEDRIIISQVFGINEYYHSIPSGDKDEDELPPGEC